MLVGQIDAGAVAAIAIDGTSSTILLGDDVGEPLTSGIMYNDTRAFAEAQQLASICPQPGGAQGASSGLAKLMWLHRQNQDRGASHVMSQADWIAARLCGETGITDWNNALKLGYDVVNRQWPDWIRQVPIRHELLPQVGAPGETLGQISAAVATRFGFSTNTVVTLGTTDSIAAFMAAGAGHKGQAVTSLGSTLVLKILAAKPVFSDRHGVYSHRLGSTWLVGGASNSGGAVLLQHFTRQELDRMTPLLRPEDPVGLDYYPLPGTGERFPINDPGMQSRIQPVPDDPVRFFQALLEGIAGIELQGYRLLQQLGAGYPDKVLSSGGGADNPGWTRIRQRLLGVPVVPAQSVDAAVGSARLARGDFNA